MQSRTTPIICTLLALALSNGCRSSSHNQTAIAASTDTSAERPSPIAVLVDSLARATGASSDWVTQLASRTHGDTPMTLGLQQLFHDTPRIIFIGALEDAWVQGDSLRVRLISDEYNLRGIVFEFVCPTSEMAGIVGRTVEDPALAWAGKEYAIVGEVLTIRPLGYAPNGMAISGTSESRTPIVVPRRLAWGTCTSIRSLP